MGPSSPIVLFKFVLQSSGFVVLYAYNIMYLLLFFYSEKGTGKPIFVVTGLSVVRFTFGIGSYGHRANNNVSYRNTNSKVDVRCN